MSKKKKKNQDMRMAAAVLGAGVILASVMFAVSKNKQLPEESDMTMGTNIFEEETTTAAPEETSASKAFVVTADTKDIIWADAEDIPEVKMPDETAPPAREDNEDTTAAPTQTKTVITHRDRSAYNGSSVYVDIKNISQEPELPVGCEITALTILLNHWGFNAEKCDMARNYLPISSGRAKYEDGKTYKDSFFDFFIGDPFSRGYGCFANAIEKAASSYINSHGGGYRVKNISGCGADTLYKYLQDEIPVIVWATDGMIEPEYYETWYDIDTGEKLDWYLNEHCAVLVGFDMDRGVVTLNDPRKGIIDYNIDKFETRFAQMHSQALVILPDGNQREESYETPAPDDETDDISEAYVSETEETTVTDNTEAETKESKKKKETVSDDDDEFFNDGEDYTVNENYEEIEIDDE